MVKYGGNLRAFPGAAAAPRRTPDKRYGSARWKRTRLAVLRRDGWRCRVVPGCDLRGTHCDHIRPVYPGMPDAEFFAMANLRAACWPHNRWRALDAAARGGRPRPAPESPVVTRDYTRARNQATTRKPA